MSNLQNLRMGAATITFGGQSLGHTNGGITFHYEPDLNDLTADQYGSTPIDKVLGGENVQIVANLAEAVVDLIQAGIPEGLMQSSSGKRLGLGRDAGFSLRTVAAQLVIHPVYKGAADLSEDIVIYKAVVADTTDLNYEADNQTVYQVTFQALVDETQASGRRLGHIGPTNIS